MGTTTLMSRDIFARVADTNSALPPRATSNQPSASAYAALSVLGVVLLVVPVVCGVAVCIGKLMHRNKETTPTIRTVNEHGRTVFRAATYEEQGLPPPTDSGPILPTSVRTPPHIARPGARLSGPSAVAPAALPHGDKVDHRPYIPRGSRYAKPRHAPAHAYPAHVSPLSPQDSLYTIDVHDDGAVSPVSMINGHYYEARHESMTAVLHQKNPYAMEPSVDDLAHIPLTPPVNASFRAHDLKPRTPGGQALSMRAWGAETSGSIASTVVDANFKRVPSIQLTQVPKRR